MDQIRIGQFIAETRKSRNLTQRQLADSLAISDKTISKWENGRGLPDASLLLPLCEALHITVNDLLSGEVVSTTDYPKQAERNLMDLMKINEENRRKMTVSIICSVITIIAVGALTAIASFLDLPTVARVILLIFSTATAAAGIWAAVVLACTAGYFECPYCQALFVPSTKEYIKSYHTFTRRRLTCPVCGNTGMCRHRLIVRP